MPARVVLIGLPADDEAALAAAPGAELQAVAAEGAGAARALADAELAILDLSALAELPSSLLMPSPPEAPDPPLLLLYDPAQPRQIEMAEQLSRARLVQLLAKEGDWRPRLPLAVQAALTAGRLRREHAAALAEEMHRLDASIECMSEGLLVLDRAYRSATINPAARALLGVGSLEEVSRKLRRGELEEGLHPVFWLEAHGEQAKPARCWELLRCERRACPAYGSGLFPCWLYDGTLCRGQEAERFPDKLAACYGCTVYQRNARVDDPASARGRREVAVERPERRILEALSAPIVDGRGQFLGVVKLLHDVTAERLLEQARADYVAFITHELATPLTSISLFLSLILAGRVGQLTEDQRGPLEAIHRQAKRLEGLVANLLDIAAIESGQVRLEPHPFDLAPVLTDTVEMLRLEASARAITLDVAPAQRPLDVVADRDRVTQVLTNLIGNAIKYAGTGSSVTVAAWVTNEGVVVEVADTGPGIAADEIPRLFDKFYRARAPAGSRVRGCGLGLAICKGIVEAHGGRMWVESAPGQGSRFCFTLPPAHDAMRA